MVQVRYILQLGNRLFQYCLGRIIAETLGFELDAAPIEGFPGTAVAVRGRAYEKPLFRYAGHQIPFESIILDPSPRKIVLEGLFQNVRYYRAYVERMRDWLSADLGHAPAVSELRDHDDDLLLHVRLGDIMPAPLSVEYYRRLLASIRFRRAYMATDEPAHPNIRALAADGVALLPSDLGPAATLRMGRRFGKLAVGNSTFGWWMAFLSDAREIHVGIPEHYEIGSPSLFRIADGLDLRLDEPRYVYHYRVPLIGEERGGDIVPLGNFCGCHQRSKAFLWRGETRA